MTTLILATRNAHKAREIQEILGKEFHYLTLNDFRGVPPVVEDAPTFEANARKKAVELAKWLAGSSLHLEGVVNRADQMKGRFLVLADDSGLEVDALEGAPGVHSARFAAMDVGSGVNSPDPANNAKLLRLLSDVSPADRMARFRCVLALAPVAVGSMQRTTMGVGDSLARQTLTFQGVCEGRIADQATGRGGFGYDPLFVPHGHNQSFAELGEAVKNRMSHRGQALGKLRAYLLK
jgi:XTP/dITP diphosphohydrolase